MKCRHCGAELSLPLVDLGSAPPSNAYLTEQTIHTPEKWFPLRVLVCERCWLVQTEDFAEREELFSADYAYFSSFATSWLAHAENYVDAMVERLNLDSTAHVIEIAANDGYLLQYVQARGIPCTGVEPTSSTAAVAREKGLDIIEDYFGNRLARELVDQGKQADLITANNVLAHVPDINDFVTGFALLLKPEGVATFEFPHLSNLLRFNQFDTIYHEHFSYLSLRSVTTIFERNGLSVFDVEKLSTHGGSLRVFAQRSDSGRQQITERVQSLLMAEQAEGLASSAAYIGFQDRTDLIKNKFLLFLLQAKEEGSTVAAYGAAAKGNTLMNYAGVRPDLIRFVVDRNPAKQGKFMPGSRVPIVEEMYLRQHKPDYVVVFPWNLKDEIACQLQYVEEWGGKIVAAVPKMEIV